MRTEASVSAVDRRRRRWRCWLVAARPVLVVEAEPVGVVAGRATTRGRAGVDHEAHRSAVDRAGRDRSGRRRPAVSTICAAAALRSAVPPRLHLRAAEAQRRRACRRPRRPHRRRASADAACTPADGGADRDVARLAVDDQQGAARPGCRPASTDCAARPMPAGQDSAAGAAPRRRRRAPSVAEVVERERLVGEFLAQQRDRRLQLVALGAGDAHRVALDRRPAP